MLEDTRKELDSDLRSIVDRPDAERYLAAAYRFRFDNSELEVKLPSVRSVHRFATGLYAKSVHIEKMA